MIDKYADRSTNEYVYSEKCMKTSIVSDTHLIHIWLCCYATVGRPTNPSSQWLLDLARTVSYKQPSATSVVCLPSLKAHGYRCNHCSELEIT